jgi:hypothetical protein
MTEMAVAFADRLRAKLKEIERKLGSVFPADVLKLKATTRSDRQKLASAWLAMEEGTLSALRKRVQSELKDLIESDAKKFNPAQFGCRTADELVDALMSLAMDRNMGSLSRRQLMDRAKGLQAALTGDLLELLIANDPLLQSLFWCFAESQIGYVNQVITDAKGVLVNVKGQSVALKGKLGAPQKVSMTYTLTFLEENQWTSRIKFVDTAYLSEIAPPGGQFVILISAEIKMPSASKELGPQLSKIEQRLIDASVFEFLIEGEKSPRTIATEKIFFSPLHMKSGVAADIDAIETSMRPSYVRRSGEYFLRIGKPVDVDAITRLTNTLVHP